MLEPTKAKDSPLAIRAILGLLAIVVVIPVAAAWVGLGTASGAVAGSKMRITTKTCTTASCPITVTMTGVVKVTPTGTMDFLIGRSVIMSTDGGPCFNEPMIPLGTAKATAACDAVGLPLGAHKITVTYSGDNYFDPSTTTKLIKVRTTV